MLTQPRQTRARLLQTVDGLLFVLALALAYLLRATIPWLGRPEIEAFTDHLWLFPIVALLGPTFLAQQGLYAQARLSSRISSILLILRGCTFATIGVILLLFFLRVQYARSVIILVGAFGGLLVYARHELTGWIQSTRLGQAQLRRRVLWVGTPEENRRLQALLSAGERDLVTSVGEFDPRSGSDEAFTADLHTHAINVAIVSLTGIEPTRITPLLAACEREGIEVLVRPGLFATSPHRLAIDQLGGEPVLHLRAQSASSGDLLIKQLIDYVGAALLLLLLAPLFAAVALLVALTSRGPILFTQRRAGLNGRPFVLYKFRSMHAGAEEHQQELASHNEMKGPVFKVAADPRVTPVGRFLRRHSLDELPQLWNVLCGEMSLVGPRPLPLEEVARFSDDAHRRRLSVKPGLTCLWQISGRNDIADFEDWVRLDLDYIDQWSLWLDFKILLATIPVALLGRGGR
ncbi:sugar transferase [Opitutaceae bacterium]